MKNFTIQLAKLSGISCAAIDAIEYEEPPTTAAESVGTSLRFADGTMVNAQFWRLIKAGKPLVSIFDHHQQYGLPTPIDAISVLRHELVDKPVVDAVLVEATGDLRFRFGGDLELQIFNFTGYEIWEVTFFDGTQEWSNHALANTNM